MLSMIDRIEAVESDSTPVRSRSMVAMGASSVGSRPLPRPGSEMRNSLTKRISG